MPTLSSPVVRMSPLQRTLENAFEVPESCSNKMLVQVVRGAGGDYVKLKHVTAAAGALIEEQDIVNAVRKSKLLKLGSTHSGTLVVYRDVQCSVDALVSLLDILTPFKVTHRACVWCNGD